MFRYFDVKIALNFTLTATVQALADSQNVLIMLRGKFKTLETQVAVHDARESKRRGKKVANLTATEMGVELQTEAVCTLGRKYSMTHCFWVSPEIFPLTANPSVNLNCAERWLSPLSMEDAVKTELFLFVPMDIHPLMAHKTFGNIVSFLQLLSMNTQTDRQFKVLLRCSGHPL